MTEDQSRVKTGVVNTFLIADIRGYTRFTEEQGDDRASELAARFADVVRVAMPHWGGELLELRGDEALCVFVSARQALGAAVDLQGRFRRPGGDGSAFPLGVGIGLDAGEAVPVDGGYRGGALNLAARLCARAAAGEILASEQVVHLARRIEGMRFESPRLVRFKGIDEQVRVVRIIPSEELPPPPQPLRSRRRPLVAILAAATVVVIIAALVTVRERGSPSVVPAAAPFRATVVSKVEIGDQRTVMTSGRAGSFLAQQSGDAQGVVDRIEQGDGSRVLSAKLALVPLGIGVGNPDVWVLTVPSYSAHTARLVRIEPNHRMTDLALPGRPGCVDFGVVTCNPVVGAGSVWVPVGTSVYRVRLDDRRIQARINVGARIFDIAYGAASVWVLSGTDLVQIDTHGNTQRRLDLAHRLGASLQPIHLTSSGGDLWISCFSTDPHRGVLLHVQTWRPKLSINTLVAYPGAGPLRAVGSSLWVSSSNGLHRLQRLDAHNGQRTGPILQLGDTVVWIATTENDLWVVTFRSSDSTRRLVHIKLAPSV